MRLVDPEENTDVLNRYGNSGVSANSKVAAILAEKQAEYDRMGQEIREKLKRGKKRSHPGGVVVVGPTPAYWL